jgi:3-hydroxyacyl-[acyl-carrier-protein] dehydratase
MKSLDINQIKQYLPHRYPLLLVDRVLDWEAGKHIRAIKNVSVNEEFLLAFLSIGQKPDDNAVVYFVGIDGARFKRPVEPGDQLVMEVEILRQSRGIWKFQAKAMVDQQLAVEAELMCTMRSISEPEPVTSA